MKVLRLAVLLALAAVAATATAGTAAAASAVVGHVYVNDNTAGVNTIAAFDRHADGTLTPIAGSPFVAGGAGTGQRIGSQGALQVSDDGRYLLAVDAGSNQISVLRIEHDGGLDQVAGGPVSSGGIEPVSVAVHGRLVYVANAGDERRAGDRRQRPVRVAVEGGDRVHAGRVVVDVDVPDDVGSGRRASGRADGAHGRDREQECETSHLHVADLLCLGGLIPPARHRAGPTWRGPFGQMNIA